MPRPDFVAFLTRLATIAGLALLACGGGGYIQLICSSAGTGGGCNRTCSLAVDGITQTLVSGQAAIYPVDEGIHIVSGTTTLSCPSGSTVTQVQETVYVPDSATITLTYPH